MSKDKKQNPANPFRFNQSKINSTKQNVPSTIDWNVLKNYIDNKGEAPKSLWGFVQSQQNTNKTPKK